MSSQFGKFYTVDSKYIADLIDVDDKVRWNKEGKYTRPYIGLVLSINELPYFIPLGSAKRNSETGEVIKKSNTFTIHITDSDNDIISYLHFNYMIPVPDKCISEVDMKTHQDTDLRYYLLLLEENKFIRSHLNDINKKALKVYDNRTKSSHSEYYNNFCIDFHNVEECFAAYTKGS